MGIRKEASRVLLCWKRGHHVVRVTSCHAFETEELKDGLKTVTRI